MRYVKEFQHAFQSSISQFSHGPDEAANALTGDTPDGYAFHTSTGRQSWWAVDLGKVLPLCMVRIFKRENFPDFYEASDIYISVSADLDKWVSLGAPHDTSAFGPYELAFNPIGARFVKVAIRDRHLSLGRIELYEEEGVIPFRGALINHETYSNRYLRSLKSGSYEGQEITFALGQLTRGDRILELGASIGVMSSVLLSEMPDIAYCAVEANTELIPVMKANHSLNKISCTIMQGAVGDKKGFVNFHKDSNFVASHISNGSNGVNAIKVEMIPFEELIEKHKPNFLICDCEGAEYQILKNARLLEGIDKIVIEMHLESGNPPDLYRFLIEAGFKAITKPPQPNKIYVGCFVRSRIAARK